MSLQTTNNPTALVDVARMLLTEALKVPHNQQFLLLSDACVPLYPPQARADAPCQRLNSNNRVKAPMSLALATGADLCLKSALLRRTVL